MEPTTFWEEAFGPGGRDTLRLLWGAKNFRTRKNKSSTFRSFKLPKGTIKIYEEHYEENTYFYWTKKYTVYFDTTNKKSPPSHFTFESTFIRHIVESMTGLTLDL